MRTLVLNFKAYAESAGPAGYRLARAAGAVARSVGSISGVRVVIVPQTPDLALFARELHGTGCGVFAQHVDAIEAGAFTGHTSLAAVKAAGCEGVLLNHSEHRVNSRQMAFVSRRAKEHGLETLFCARDVREAARLAKLFSPVMVAVEPPELIGGEVSVSTAKPEIVSGAVKAIKKAGHSSMVLVGAGVRNGEDVRKSIELGADGVLLAHAFVRSKEPEEFLKELVLAMGAKK